MGTLAALGRGAVRDDQRLHDLGPHRVERGADPERRAATGTRLVEELREDMLLRLALDPALGLQRRFQDSVITGRLRGRKNGGEAMVQRPGQKTSKVFGRLLRPENDQAVEPAPLIEVDEPLHHSFEVPAHVGLVVTLVSALRETALVMLGGDLLVFEGSFTRSLKAI